MSTHWKERLPLHAGVWFHILLLLALAGPVAAATITIDPSTPGGIARAITAAGAGDTIILNPGTYTENGITVSKNLIIRANTTYGHGYADTIIDGSNAGRILAVNALVTLTLDNLTLTRGNAGAGSGGAIRNSDTLTVTNVHFTSCTAASGGAIDNPGTATITASEFTSCSAPYGGAIVNGGTMSVQTSVFSGCSATGTSGGAIYNGGTIPSIKSTVFSGCTANTNGGAINNFNTGTITSIQFSRFYNNNAGTSGKAIYKLPFAGTITDTSDNWWGTNTDPAGVLSNVDTYVPYLLLNASAFPPSLTSAQTTVVQANLTYDSTGTGTIASGHIPDGTTVTFAVMSGPGSVSPASNTTKNGAAETTFTPSGAGTTNISATVDGQTVFTTVTTTWGVPVVTGITPASGSTSGGTVVTITGSGFSGATAVNFGAAASSGFTVNSNTRITATSPAGAAGSVDITVTTPGGTSATAPVDRFTYAVIQESPASLPGGTTTGSGSDDYSGPGTSVTPGTITVNVGGNTAVHQATVTGTGLSGLIVTGTGQATAGPEVPPPPGIVYQYIDLVPARFTTITGTAITFTVPVPWLEEHHLTPQEIVMYHYTGGKWTALPTTAGTASNGRVTFTAASPSFSLFAITGQPGPEVTVVPAEKTSGDLQEPAAPVPATAVKTPVVQQTTAAPAPAAVPEPSFPVPVLAIAGMIVLVAGGFVVRRWWIRRQNPALFAEYD